MFQVRRSRFVFGASLVAVLLFGVRLLPAPALQAPGQAPDWPQFRGPNRDGASPRSSSRRLGRSG